MRLSGSLQSARMWFGGFGTGDGSFRMPSDGSALGRWRFLWRDCKKMVALSDEVALPWRNCKKMVSVQPRPAHIRHHFSAILPIHGHRAVGSHQKSAIPPLASAFAVYSHQKPAILPRGRWATYEVMPMDTVSVPVYVDCRESLRIAGEPD